MPEGAEELASASRAYLVAPAGYGKTEALTWAAAVHSEGRQLVLTHTHAGVKAVKDRLRGIGTPGGRVHVDTLAGFALRYAASFPATSGLLTTEPTETDEWNAVYEAAIKVLGSRVGRTVLTESYRGVFVDEYQDCVLPQHELVLTLAATLPCRIVLDPLQGIFGFGAQSLVTVDEHLEPTFERLEDLTTPWRWLQQNPDLGEWLAEARQALQMGQSIDLQGAPVSQVEATPASRIGTCLQRANLAGSVVAIGQWPADCHSVASKLNGAFTCMEPIECPDLLKWAARIEESEGPARAAHIVDFSASCMTRVGSILRRARDSFRGQTLANVLGSPQTRSTIEALNEVASDPTLTTVVRAMAAIEALPGRVLHRRELWREMERAIRGFDAGRRATLAEAAWYIRDRGRHIGRRVEYRTVSRTLLVKGLEFDHAIILNGDAHDSRNLYVAMTRGARSLTILSGGPIIQPQAS
ncbi:MAG TPA: hypothetical protein VNA87_06040 [Actinomycetota bacterium]|nr:hypothetical protein [Actinomycetota bacterium]